MIFHPTKGPVNYLLMTICGIEQKNLPNWFSGNLIMLTLILFSVWKYMGYYMVIYLAGLQGISSELYEEASTGRRPGRNLNISPGRSCDPPPFSLS